MYQCDFCRNLGETECPIHGKCQAEIASIYARRQEANEWIQANLVEMREGHPSIVVPANPENLLQVIMRCMEYARSSVNQAGPTPPRPACARFTFIEFDRPELTAEAA